MARRIPPINECKSLPQIAATLGLTDQALYNLRNRYRTFPESIGMIGNAQVYWEPEVLEFHKEVGHGYREPKRKRSK